MSTTLHSLSRHLECKRTLYFRHTAGSVFLRGKHLVHQRGDTEDVCALADIRRVVLLGRPGVESAILYRLMRAGIPVDWLDPFGRPLGQLLSLEDPADRTVVRQGEFCRSAAALELARAILLARMDNAREVLRRRCPIPQGWDACRERLGRAATPEQLRGAEGLGARLYFSCWQSLSGPFPWLGRKAHPAPDPVNVLLSLGYGLLHNRLASALRHAGLDPRTGFFHAGRGRHCALASDIMEQWRPLVDATVLRLVRRGQLAPRHFDRRNGRCILRDQDAFRLVMNSFEEMFSRRLSLYVYVDGAWQARCRTLNDHLEDTARAFAWQIAGGSSCNALRIRPCPVI